MKKRAPSGYSFKLCPEFTKPAGYNFKLHPVFTNNKSSINPPHSIEKKSVLAQKKATYRVKIQDYGAAAGRSSPF